MSPNDQHDYSKHSNPNEFLDIPKWVNEDYFQPILEKDVKDFAYIKNFSPIAATKPGENFTSIMVRVIIDIELKDGSEKQISYILKTTLDASKGGEIVASLGLFCKEKLMYHVHIPNFTRLYKEAGVDIELAPRCVHVQESPERTTLVLEDLKCQQFQNVDRLKGLDMAHMRRVLHKVAELHAASAATYELNGPYEQMYQNSIFNESIQEQLEQIGKMRQRQYVKAMREWKLPNAEKYIDMLTPPTQFYKKAIALNKVDESDFNVLNHGDLWCNNIMFSGERTLFVDLQISKWGSPAQDLWYLIITSASLDIKIKEFDHFIRIYHDRLVECLKLLKYPKKIPTLRELHIMMIKYGNWGISTARSVLIPILMPSDKNSSVDMMMTPGPEGDAFRFKTFTNPYYANAMVQIFPFLENKGLLKEN